MVAPRPSGYYRGRSRNFLTLVDNMLASGELEAACEMLWGAAAHAIKASAQLRGWEHDTHTKLRISVDRLVAEENAPPYLLGQYGMASRFHEGFYGRPFRAEQINAGKQPIAQFIQTLESLPSANPAA